MWIELLAGAAWAGACCSGSMTTSPARVGECEHVAVATTLSGEHALGRWDADGRVKAPSPDEDAVVGVLGVGWRWSRAAQLQVTVPGRFAWRDTGALSDTGGGLGDVGIGMIWDPVDEDDGPVPVLTVGARLPTGRTWEDSDSPLLADVTGLPGPALRLGLAAERALPRTPWSAGVDVEAGPDAPVAVAASASIGRTIGREWSVAAGVRHVATFVGGGTGRTTLSAQLVRGQRLAWRTWAGVGADVPVRGLGRSSTAELTATVGIAVVR
jgi:hypothetical protein